MSNNVTSVLFKKEARRKLFEGMEIAANAVTTTLGPRGKTVLIQKKGETPIVTKDGVTVSKSINLKDPVQRMGAELIREAAAQTNESAGDGTTTATILTYSMVKEGLKLLEAGFSPKELSRGLERARGTAETLLLSSSKRLAGSAEIAQIGTISANGDKKIGELIADAMERVGRDGIITVEDAKGTTTSLDVLEGLQFDRGYLSPYFVTNTEKMTAAYQDARVLISDKKISTMKELVPVLERVMGARQPLIIIADDIEGEALQGLVLNRVNGNLPVVAVKAPGYGMHRHDLLGDIAILAGAKIASPSTGLKIESMTLQDLGTLKRVVVDAKGTVLVGTGGTKSLVDEHVATLKTQLEDLTLTGDEIVKLKTRIAKLAAGVAVIRVGGATEVEMIERKYRIEDALHATRAAAEEGIVPGGGMALIGISSALEASFSGLSEEERAGASIVLKSCFAPLRKIVENCETSADVVIKELLTRRETEEGPRFGWGYNAATGQFTSLIDEGIIDPVKVTRTALKNAASVASTFINLDAVVFEEEGGNVQ
jgi:chaperonin GroEL